MKGGCEPDERRHLDHRCGDGAASSHDFTGSRRQAGRDHPRDEGGL